MAILVETKSHFPSCDVCGTTDVRKQYEFPIADGPHATLPATLRRLFHCQSCDHLSVDLWERSLYEKYYKELTSEYHAVHDADLSRYKQILGKLLPSQIKTAIDFGCGTGSFLKLLPNTVKKYGVELSSNAAAAAVSNGIQVLSYQDLDREEFKHGFDLVTAIDFIEHTNALSMLRRYFAKLLRPGGSLVLMTGDISSTAAHHVGKFWYYLHYSEHISFFSRSSMQRWLEEDFECIQIFSATHHPLRPMEVRAWLFSPLKLLLNTFIEPRRWMVSLPVVRDHMIVCATKKCNS